MKILAIDPGSAESAWVVFETSTSEIVGKGKRPNGFALQIFERVDADRCVIEMIASYGMAVGASVFDTCVWIGRFAEAWDRREFDGELPAEFLFRKDVKLCLCGSMRAKYANIRQAIIDRYPASGGGKNPQVGTKKDPGPLYGVKADIWAALGVAITASELIEGATR